jgi:hypothetical protein
MNCSKAAPRIDRIAGRNKTALIHYSIQRLASVCFALLTAVVPHALANDNIGQNPAANVVDATALHGKVMCGYQGWFRCPGDHAKQGWIHWSRDSSRIAPDTLTFELWPDMTDYPAAERFPAPGFTGAEGAQAYLFSNEQPGTVRRHFQWMRDYGIDGVWLQHFLVDLPGGPLQDRYASRSRVLQNVRAAAQETGRVWAVAFDIAGLPADKIVDVLTREWKKLVHEGITQDPRYLHEGGLPVVEIWGFYYGDPNNRMTAAVANQLIDFFKASGPTNRAFLIGGGDWQWRLNPDLKWQKFLRRFDAYSPWNVGNYSKDGDGAHASIASWAEDQRECEKCGLFWLPVVYPGFSWDNLQKLPAGTSLIPRRDGKFLWEQFHALSKLHVDTVCVAMFDEVDEGTAIFKVTSSPPVQGHFVTYDGLPSDWYLRLVGEAAKLLRQQREVPASIPIHF